MPIFWNSHYYAYTEINLETGKVTWTETKPLKEAFVRITAADNGFVLASGEICEVYKSLWDVKTRLGDLLEQSTPREEDFLPSHYHQKDLVKLGLGNSTP